MMSTAKSHPILNYFKKTNGGNRSSCNKCCIQSTCPNSGTTNMIQHLQRKHVRLHKLYSEEKEKFDPQKQKTRKTPLEFWNLNKLCFPKQAEAVRIVLAIPATVAPSEKIWSDAGNIVTDVRQNLSPMNFRMLLFLTENLKI